MFERCKIGIGFNTMSTHVNFQKENLYYRDTTELMAWCMSALTPRLELTFNMNYFSDRFTYTRKIPF